MEKINLTRKEADSLLIDNGYKVIKLDKVSDYFDVYEKKGKPHIKLKINSHTFKREWLNKQI